MRVGEAQDSLVPDLNLWLLAPASDAGGERFVLESMAERRVSKFLDAGGRVIEVQSVRYVGPDGWSRRMLICGECGHVTTVALEEVGRPGSLACRKCAAGLSRPGCAVPHAFGECDSCRGVAFP